jgi:hypothetical protein
MRQKNKALEVIATCNVLTASILGVVVLPLMLLVSPANAYPTPQSQEEYEQYVKEADARIVQASSELQNARTNLVDASSALDYAQEQLVVADSRVTQSVLDLALAQAAYDKAEDGVQVAQSNYDTNLIVDPTTSAQERVPGIRADIYNQISSPNPTRADNIYNLCKTVTFTHINHQWGGGNIEGCGSEYVMIHYTGYLTVPEATPYGYDFLNNADDGWYMTLDGMVINDNWVLKGCGGWWSQKFQLEAGRSYQLDAWYYEWGGGACSTLYYDNGYNWGVVPAAWYSQNDYAEVTYIHDSTLLAILEEKQTVRRRAGLQLESATVESSSAQDWYRQAVNLHGQAVQTRLDAESAIPALEENLQIALDMRESIQPYVPYVEPEPKPEPEPTRQTEPEPEPEPVAPVEETPAEELPSASELTSEVLLELDLTEIDPTTITPEQVEALQEAAYETFLTAEPGSEEYEQALDALYLAAEADDIVLSEELAAVPGLAAAVELVNFLGNAGADMSPEVREESEKVVVAAVVAAGAAIQSAAAAASVSTRKP